MPWPDFSELSFGFSFLREFEKIYAPNGRFPSAPDFISQNDEFVKGYDVQVALSGSAPVFFQFKRSFVLTTRNAIEIQSGDFNRPDLYRMYFHKKNNYNQHRVLRRFEKAGNNVFYVTSQISALSDLSAAYLASNVVEDCAAIFSPREIKLPRTKTAHHLTFRANANSANVYSENGHRFSRKYHSWQSVRQVLEVNRATLSENRQKLAAIATQLASADNEAARIAERFEHPAVKASILAFLVLDSQLTLYRPPEAI